MSFLTQMGTATVPQVFTALASAGIVDTMSVSRTARTPDGMGGTTDGSTTTPYTNVPVSVEPDRKNGQRIDTQGKPVTVRTQILEFPNVQSGSLMVIDTATDKLVINARSPYPARTYRILCPADDVEAVNRFVCVLEG